MVELKDFFEKIMVIGEGKRGGDKIKISDSKGRAANIDMSSHYLKASVITHVRNFLEILSKKTGWGFNDDKCFWTISSHCSEEGQRKTGKGPLRRFNEKESGLFGNYQQE